MLLAKRSQASACGSPYPEPLLLAAGGVSPAPSGEVTSGDDGMGLGALLLISGQGPLSAADRGFRSRAPVGSRGLCVARRQLQTNGFPRRSGTRVGWLVGAALFRWEVC